MFLICRFHYSKYFLVTGNYASLYYRTCRVNLTGILFFFFFLHSALLQSPLGAIYKENSYRNILQSEYNNEIGRAHV